MPDSPIPIPSPDDINNADQFRCWPKKPITVTVVRCKDHQPIILFTLSQPTTGEIYPINNGTNIVRPCVLPGDSFRISANGYNYKDVVVPASAVNDGFLEVCLDEAPPPPPPTGPRRCFVLSLLGVSTEPNASRFADVLRGFRDVLLGMPSGRTLVAHYYNESVQKELTDRLSKPTRVIEVFRLLVEATPFVMRFVEPRQKAFSASCSCGEAIVLDEQLAKNALKLISSLKKEVESAEVRDALDFVEWVVEQSSGKAPGQFLAVLTQHSVKSDG